MLRLRHRSTPRVPDPARPERGPSAHRPTPLRHRRTTVRKGHGAGTLDKTKELMAIVYPRFAKLPPYVAPAEGS
jgi:hypothetical protein